MTFFHKRIYYAKIILSLVFSFFIASFLTQYVFLGGSPYLQAHAYENIASIPNTVINRVKSVLSVGGRVAPNPPTNDTQARKLPLPAPDTSDQSTSDKPSERTERPGKLPTPTIPEIKLPFKFPTLPPFFPNPTAPDIQPDQERGTPEKQSDREQGQKKETALKPSPTLAPVSLESKEREVIKLINERRKKQGLSEVAAHSALVTSARQHSVQLQQKGVCGHLGNFSQRSKKAGYSGSPYGETVACMAGRASDAVSWWWASPRHKEILTANGIKHIGAGWKGTYVTVVVGY